MTALNGDIILKTIKNGVALKCHESEIELSFEQSQELKILLKAIFTTNPENKLGKCIQIPRKIICLFRRNGVEFIQKSTRILVDYNQFQKVCHSLANETLGCRIRDQYESQLAKNFLQITMCLREEDRKEVILVLRNQDEKNMDKLFNTVLKSSGLDHRNDYFKFVIRSLFLKNIHYFDLVLYAKKIADF